MFLLIRGEPTRAYCTAHWPVPSTHHGEQPKMLDSTTPAEQKARKETRRGRIDRENGQVVLSGGGQAEAAYKLHPLSADVIEYLALHGLRSVLQTARDEAAAYDRLHQGRVERNRAPGRSNRVSLWKQAAAQVLAEEHGTTYDAAFERVRHFDRGQLMQLRHIAKVAEIHAKLSGQQPPSVSQLLGAAS